MRLRAGRSEREPGAADRRLLAATGQPRPGAVAQRPLPGGHAADQGPHERRGGRCRDPPGQAADRIRGLRRDRPALGRQRPLGVLAGPAQHADRARPPGRRWADHGPSRRLGVAQARADAARDDEERAAGVPRFVLPRTGARQRGRDPGQRDQRPGRTGRVPRQRTHRAQDDPQRRPAAPRVPLGARSRVGAAGGGVVERGQCRGDRLVSRVGRRAVDRAVPAAARQRAHGGTAGLRRRQPDV